MYYVFIYYVLCIMACMYYIHVLYTCVISQRAVRGESLKTLEYLLRSLEPFTPSGYYMYVFVYVCMYVCIAFYLCFSLCLFRQSASLIYSNIFSFSGFIFIWASLFYF